MEEEWKGCLRQVQALWRTKGRIGTALLSIRRGLGVSNTPPCLALESILPVQIRGIG